MPLVKAAILQGLMTLTSMEQAKLATETGPKLPDVSLLTDSSKSFRMGKQCQKNGGRKMERDRCARKGRLSHIQPVIFCGLKRHVARHVGALLGKCENWCGQAGK